MKWQALQDPGCQRRQNGDEADVAKDVCVDVFGLVVAIGSGR